jgi:hypothetical protein
MGSRRAPEWRFGRRRDRAIYTPLEPDLLTIEKREVWPPLALSRPRTRAPSHPPRARCGRRAQEQSSPFRASRMSSATARTIPRTHPLVRQKIDAPPKELRKDERAAGPDRLLAAPEPESARGRVVFPHAEPSRPPLRSRVTYAITRPCGSTALASTVTGTPLVDDDAIVAPSAKYETAFGSAPSQRKRASRAEPPRGCARPIW